MTTELVTAYFDGEGRPWMFECIHRAADWCLSANITTLVIFTGTGEGPHYAAKELLVREQYRHLKVVAVTPPVGRQYKKDPTDPASPVVHSGIKDAMRDELTALGVVVISAHLPFKEMYDGRNRTSEWSRVSEALAALGGGFPYCIQAVLMACDAGALKHGERVVALSADTAFVARACRTESFLSPLEGLLVEHVICRPARYNISKMHHETIAPREHEQKPEPALPLRATPILAEGAEVPAKQLRSKSRKAKPEPSREHSSKRPAKHGGRASSGRTRSKSRG
jgi:uncharacterized protein